MDGEEEGGRANDREGQQQQQQLASNEPLQIWQLTGNDTFRDRSLHFRSSLGRSVGQAVGPILHLQGLQE